MRAGEARSLMLKETSFFAEANQSAFQSHSEFCLSKTISNLKLG